MKPEAFSPPDFSVLRLISKGSSALAVRHLTVYLQESTECYQEVLDAKSPALLHDAVHRLFSFACVLKVETLMAACKNLENEAMRLTKNRQKELTEALDSQMQGLKRAVALKIQAFEAGETP